MRHYTVVTVVALPGLTTEGDTCDEAITNAKDAIALYIADVEAGGEAVSGERLPPAVVDVAV